MRNFLLTATIATLAVMAPASAQEQVAAAPVTPVQTVELAPAADPFPPLASLPEIGQPRGTWRLQEPMTPIAREAHSFTRGVLDPMMIGISVFVLVLLGWVIFRYRAARSPVASRTSHNTTVEVIWTVVPVLILVWIAVPSFRLLANQYDPPRADLTIKAIGHQWYWEYEYPDQGGFSFDSIMLKTEEAKARGSVDQLDVDNRVVVPVNATVKVLVTSADVGHSWAVPSFWVKMDAWPGRVNETWFKAEREGVYYGPCSELCGTRHAFMPIAVEVVSRERFARWVAARQAENGITPGGPAAPASGSVLPTPAISPAGDAAAEAATAVTPAVPTAEAAPAAPVPAN